MRMQQLISLVAVMACSVAGAWGEELPMREVELGLTHDTLGRGYANWDSSYLDAVHHMGKHQSVYGEVRRANRFGSVDREISGGYYHPLSENWITLIEASLSSTHQFLPQKSALFQLQRTFEGGWDIQAGVRRSVYNVSTSNMLIMGGERYWDNYRAAYKLFLSKLQGAGSASSHNIELSYYFASRSYLTFSMAYGRQVESLGPNLGVMTNNVTTFVLHGRHWLDASWAISYEALTEKQGNIYTRKGARLGLRYAF